MTHDRFTMARKINEPDLSRWTMFTVELGDTTHVYVVSHNALVPATSWELNAWLWQEMRSRDVHFDNEPHGQYLQVPTRHMPKFLEFCKTRFMLISTGTPVTR